MRLREGDKIWVSAEDGAITSGWAVWEATETLGLGFRGSCHFFYTIGEIYELSEWAGRLDNENDYCCMAQQLIAEGAI